MIEWVENIPSQVIALTALLFHQHGGEIIMSSADEAIRKIPENDRRSWISPAIVFAGVEFSVPVIMVGTGLVGSYGIYALAGIVLIGLAITWVGDFLMAYVGAKTGRPSTVIARSSFGTTQARTLVSTIVAISSLGWWGIQTAIMADAVSQVLNITPAQSWFLWALIVVILGLVFATPAISGYESIEWVDYAAVPAGLLILLAGVYLAVQQFGVDGITQGIEIQSMSLTVAISTVLGANTIQWIIISDYSRQHNPTLRDSILMPSLIIVVGFILMMIGGVMAVGVGGSFNLVDVMATLGFPVWGYLLLFIAQWTSQLVNVYTPGLAIANALDVSDPNKRRLVTFGITIIGIALALAGILSRFQDFLLIIGFTAPAVGAVIVTDFILIKNESWEEIEGWNWIATIAFVVGFGMGYFTQYVYVIGLPAVQSYIITSAVYYLLMKVKASISPDKFTTENGMKQFS